MGTDGVVNYVVQVALLCVLDSGSSFRDPFLPWFSEVPRKFSKSSIH